jgi:hypothetical protein
LLELLAPQLVDLVVQCQRKSLFLAGREIINGDEKELGFHFSSISGNGRGLLRVLMEGTGWL